MNISIYQTAVIYRYNIIQLLNTIFSIQPLVESCYILQELLRYIIVLCTVQPYQYLFYFVH